MRKLILLLFLSTFFSCEKNETNDLLPDATVNETINLNLSQYVNLLTPSGWVYASGGVKGIFIQYSGTSYKAFDRACPNYDCSKAMTFDGSLKLKCSCDSSEYSIIDGSPQTSGNSYFAREYKVNVVSSTSLIITNN
jgi:nitrite reductase/ring-hydroxylating ferredoxin subunit